jgi:RNA polymerase sigma-70 factor (ECF subfamily)
MQIVKQEDEALVAAIRAGSKAAGAMLYDRAHPIVDRVLRRILGGGDRDHEDVAQRVMLELLRSVPNLRNDGSLDGFVARVTAHTAYKHLRRRKTENRLFETHEEAGDDMPSPTPAPERLTMLRAFVARVRGHLEALGPEKSWTLLLHHVDGRPMKDIARMMGISLAAAQARLFRARRELLARLLADPELSPAAG